MNYSEIWEAHWPWVLYFGATWAMFGAGVGRRHNQAGLGFFFGLVLGPLGVALTYALVNEPVRSAPEGADPDLDLGLARQDRPPNVRRPSDVDRAGPFVPPEGSTEEDRKRWANQMLAQANEELERRKRGEY